MSWSLSRRQAGRQAGRHARTHALRHARTHVRTHASTHARTQRRRFMNTIATARTQTLGSTYLRVARISCVVDSGPRKNNAHPASLWRTLPGHPRAPMSQCWSDCNLHFFKNGRLFFSRVRHSHLDASTLNVGAGGCAGRPISDRWALFFLAPVFNVQKCNSEKRVFEGHQKQ